MQMGMPMDTLIAPLRSSLQPHSVIQLSDMRFDLYRSLAVMVLVLGVMAALDRRRVWIG